MKNGGFLLDSDGFLGKTQINLAFLSTFRNFSYGEVTSSRK